MTPPPHQVSGMPGFPDDAAGQCLNALQAAFRGCTRPADIFLVSPGCLRAAGVALETWGTIQQEEIENLGRFGSDLAEALPCLSTDAVRHFLPALLAFTIRHPSRVDALAFSLLVSHMQDMWIRSLTCRRCRSVRLTPSQAAAVAGWCRIFCQLPWPFPHRDHQDLWMKENLLYILGQLAIALPGAVDRTDYDREHRACLAETYGVAQEFLAPDLQPPPLQPELILRLPPLPRRTRRQARSIQDGV